MKLSAKGRAAHIAALALRRMGKNDNVGISLGPVPDEVLELVRKDKRFSYVGSPGFSGSIYFCKARETP